MLIKNAFAPSELRPPCLSFFLFFLSLYFCISGLFLGARRPAELTFLPGLLRPSQKAHCAFTHSRGRPVPTCSSASPKNRALLAFRVNQGTSASFSLSLSGPPGSGPLKDQQALSASLSLLLSYPRLWTTRFRSIKGPTNEYLIFILRWLV